ncbi:hypothetical protein V4V60_003781 [Vibrio mimicus]
MVVEVRRAEPSDARAIKGIYECQNAYTGTLQLPFPSSDMWEKRFQNIPEYSRIFQSMFMYMWH